MRILPCLLVALLLVLSAAGTASPQMGMGAHAPEFRGVWNPVVGSGAAYEVASNSGTSEFELAVVGKETVGGKDAFWLQMAFDQPREGGRMYMKNLMVVDGANTRITRMIMQMPGRPPMEMPAGMMGMGGQGPQTSAPADIRSTAEHVGAESVTTPAGTFNTEHYRARDGSWEAWISPDVAPWGLVRSVSRGTTTTLLRVVTDAKDQITGTPQQFNPADMMRGMGRP